MQNARLDELQIRIKIAWRNINNLTYADDTILMAESEGELKSLLMRVKNPLEESEKPGSSSGKEYAFNAGDPRLIPGSGRLPG